MPFIILSWRKHDRESTQGYHTHIFIKRQHFIYNQPLRWYEGIAKDIFDRIIALLFMVLIGPLFLVISLFIAISSKGPIFFKQERIGKGEKAFIMLKFRTMFSDFDPDRVETLAPISDIRFTKIGRFLRITSLDELPQLFNVLKGDMSLVGPRPERPEFAQAMQEFRLLRSVKPGITGWGSLEYPNIRTEDEMRQVFKADIYYLNHRSFWFDIKIFIRYLRMIIANLSNVYSHNG